MNEPTEKYIEDWQKRFKHERRHVGRVIQVGAEQKVKTAEQNQLDLIKELRSKTPGPNWKCRLGFHKWLIYGYDADDYQDQYWTQTCLRCGKTENKERHTML